MTLRVAPRRSQMVRKTGRDFAVQATRRRIAQYVKKTYAQRESKKLLKGAAKSQIAFRLAAHREVPHPHEEPPLYHRSGAIGEEEGWAAGLAGTQPIQKVVQNRCVLTAPVLAPARAHREAAQE